MERDMTKGSPAKLIFLFGLPILLSNVFQQFYNIADTAIVGHMLGDYALSAVGAVSSVYGLLLSISFGLTNGFSILVSRYYGSREEEKMRKAIASTIMLSALAAVLITLVGVAGMRWFLQFLHIPDEIMEDGYRYITIIVAFFAVNFLYNAMASILRAVGNSVVPLVILIISTLFNILLDIMFISVWNMGIAGAAYATVLAQFVASVICFIYILKRCPVLHLKKEDFAFDSTILYEVFASGIAMAMMFGVVNIGTVILQSGINGLGVDTIAAHVAARKISEVYMMPASALGSTMATFASQNYGAGRLERVKLGVNTAIGIGFIWSTMVIIITYLFASPLMQMLTGSDNAQLIATGAAYLKINLPFYYVLIILCVLRSTLQAIGDKVLPVVSSTLELLGKMATTAIFIAPFGYMAVCFSEPVTWIVCAGLLMIVYFRRIRC